MKNGFMQYSVIMATVFAVLAAAPAHADFDLNGNYAGNVAATSTYVWRGLAQTSGAALQGGPTIPIHRVSTPEFGRLMWIQM